MERRDNKNCGKEVKNGWILYERDQKFENRIRIKVYMKFSILFAFDRVLYMKVH